MEKITCNKCKTENSTELKNCSNCSNELNESDNLPITFLTPRVKFQIVLAIVVFLVAFFGTKYLIAEYKKSDKEVVKIIDNVTVN